MEPFKVKLINFPKITEPLVAAALLLREREHERERAWRRYAKAAGRTAQGRVIRPIKVQR